MKKIRTKGETASQIKTCPAGAAKEENVMGVVIGKMDGQVEKIFLGNNLTRSTKNYAKILKDENLSEEEKQRILAAEKKKQEEDIIL